eukprot:1161011-Pelagomonas_calceolata.AAC.3
MHHNHRPVTEEQLRVLGAPCLPPHLTSRAPRTLSNLPWQMDPQYTAVNHLLLSVSVLQVADATVPGIKHAAVRKLQHELGIPPQQLPLSSFRCDGVLWVVSAGAACIVAGPLAGVASDGHRDPARRKSQSLKGFSSRFHWMPCSGTRVQYWLTCEVVRSMVAQCVSESCRVH